MVCISGFTFAQWMVGSEFETDVQELIRLWGLSIIPGGVNKIYSPEIYIYWSVKAVFKTVLRICKKEYSLLSFNLLLWVAGYKETLININLQLKLIIFFTIFAT